jgi:hypothetical protein
MKRIRDLVAGLVPMLKPTLAPKAPPEPTPGVWLPAGPHKIQWRQLATGRPFRDDGSDKSVITVEIGAGGQWYKLPRWGCYVIDSKITHIRDPRVGRITLAHTEQNS